MFDLSLSTSRPILKTYVRYLSTYHCALDHFPKISRSRRRRTTWHGWLIFQCWSIVKAQKLKHKVYLARNRPFAWLLSGFVSGTENRLLRATQSFWIVKTPMQNAFFKLFRFDFDRCFCTVREKRPLARSFTVVEQVLNLFFWPPQAFKVVPYFSFHWCRVYMKLDLARHIHVSCAELRYLVDVRLESTDRHFIEKSDLATM